MQDYSWLNFSQDTKYDWLKPRPLPKQVDWEDLFKTVKKPERSGLANAVLSLGRTITGDISMGAISNEEFMTGQFGPAKQFASGLVKTATGGFVDIANEPPKNAWEQVASGAGSLTGFLAPLGLAGKATRLALDSKMAGNILKQIPKTGAAILKYAMKNASTMALAEGLSNLKSEIEDPNTIMGNIGHGALLGSIFGGTALLKMKKYPILWWAARQGVGRALMSVAGLYPEGYMSGDNLKENLPSIIFSEGLNTFFLSKGIKPSQILTGEGLSKEQFGIIQQVHNQIESFQKELQTKGFELKDVKPIRNIPAIRLLKPNTTTHEVGADLSNEEQITSHIKRITGQKTPNDNAIDVRYDPTLDKYVPIKNTEMFEAHKRINVEKQKVLDSVMSEFKNIKERATNIIADNGSTEQGLVGQDAQIVARYNELRDVIKKNTPYVPARVLMGKGYTPYQIKDLFEMAGDWFGDPTDSQAIKKLLQADTFFYDAKTRMIRVGMSDDTTMEGTRPKEVRLKYDMVTRTMSPIEFGTGITVKQEEMANKALGATDRLRKLPIKPVFKDALKPIETAMRGLNMPIETLDQFLVGFKDIIPDINKPRLIDLYLLEDKINELVKLPPGAREEKFFKDALRLYGIKVPDEISLDKAITNKKGIDAAFIWKKRGDIIKYYKARMILGEEQGTLTSKLLTLNFVDRYADSRFTLDSLEQKTGFPWESVIGKWLRNASESRNAEYKQLTDRLIPISKLDKEDQYQISKYYDAKFNKKDLPKLNETQANAIDTIDKLMQDMAPDVKYYRMMNFIKQYEKANGEFEKTYSVYKHQADLKNDLLEGYGIWKTMFGDRNNQELALRDWLKDKNFGVIEDSNYLPSAIFGNLTKHQWQEFLSEVDIIGKSHTKMRTDKHLDTDIDQLMESLTQSPLVNRLNGYIKQVMNLKHLDAPLSALDDAIDIFGDAIARTKPERLIGQGINAKGYTTNDYLNLFAHRLKGYPVKIAGFASAVRAAQSMFFRALVVKPFLWIRNLFQPIVAPHKEAVFDPRFLLPKYRYANLEDNIKEFYINHVSQLPSFQNEYLMLDATKGIGNNILFRLAESLGKTYPITDAMTRKFVFARTYNRTKYYLDLYANGKIDVNNMEKRIGVSRMTHGDRTNIRDLLEQKNYKKAALETAKWNVDNSQWVYTRAQKSFYEMTSDGESYTNLLTWSKGITQQVYNAGKNIFEGFDREDPAMVKAGTTQLITLAIGGHIAQQLINYIGKKYVAKYKDYGVGMFTWEMGGVSFKIVRDFSEAIANYVEAIDDTPDARKNALSVIIKFVDNTMFRQMIPFVPQALSVAEAITGRAYISPIYDLFHKYEGTFVDRTLEERFSHAILMTDPNKSKYAFKWVSDTAEKYRKLSMSTKIPGIKQYYEIQTARYDNFAKIFSRYQPLHLQKYYDQLQLQESKDEVKNLKIEEILGKEKRDTLMETRKAKGVYK
jgi:hypothetical protein